MSIPAIARALIAVTLVLTWLLLVAVRPILGLVVLVAAGLGGILGVLFSRALVTGGDGGPRRRRPSSGDGEITRGQTLRQLGVIGVALLVVVGSAALVANTALYSIDTRLGSRPLRAAYSATYDTRDRLQDRTWRVHEVFRVPRTRLTRLLRRTGRVQLRGALRSGWAYRRTLSSARVAVYSNTRDAPLTISLLPILHSDDISCRTKDPRYGLAVAGYRSTLTFKGPLRLIYHTDPPESARHDFAGEETVQVKTANPLTDPDAERVRIQLANAAGRREIYRRLHDQGFWTVLAILLSAVLTPLVGWGVVRWANTRWPPRAGVARRRPDRVLQLNQASSQATQMRRRQAPGSRDVCTTTVERQWPC